MHVYSYGTPIRVWDTVLSHTRMDRYTHMGQNITAERHNMQFGYVSSCSVITYESLLSIEGLVCVLSRIHEYCSTVLEGLNN